MRVNECAKSYEQIFLDYLIGSALAECWGQPPHAQPPESGVKCVRFRRHTDRRGELVLREPKLQANGADVASVGPWR
jgi:hypothetical protein